MLHHCEGETREARGIDRVIKTITVAAQQEFLSSQPVKYLLRHELTGVFMNRILIFHSWCWWVDMYGQNCCFKGLEARLCTDYPLVTIFIPVHTKLHISKERKKICTNRGFIKF